MDINQAFEILKRAAGPCEARVVLDALLFSPSLRGSVTRSVTRGSSPQSASPTAPLKKGGTAQNPVFWNLCIEILEKIS